MISGLIGLVIQVINIALLAYCALSFLMPQHNLTQLLGRYLEPMLDPIRRWLDGLLRKGGINLPLDVSPLVLAMILSLVERIVRIIL